VKQLFLIILSFFLLINNIGAEKLKIYTEQDPPTNFKDKNGKITGFAVEIVKEIQKRINSKEKIEILPWKRAYLYVTGPDRNNIILFSMTFTEERRGLFKWVGPINEYSWVFFAKSDSNLIIKNLDDAKKVKSIGTYAGDVREQYLKSKGFTNLDILYTANANNLDKLLIGRIDLWVTSYIEARNYAEMKGIDYKKIKPGYTIQSKGSYIAFHKNTSDAIVRKWQKAYDGIRKDGTLERILNRWNQILPNHVIPASPKP